jgi:hypothetical protein
MLVEGDPIPRKTGKNSGFATFGFTNCGESFAFVNRRKTTKSKGGGRRYWYTTRSGGGVSATAWPAVSSGSSCL